MIQFQQIIYFLKIAELRSINKAAAKLYVSQPSLSQSIKNLEDELNIRLFRRSNKGVVLTEDGKVGQREAGKSSVCGAVPHGFHSEADSGFL